MADSATITANIISGSGITTTVNESTTVSANVVTGGKGDPGDAGPEGPQGPPGTGVSSGGTTGQVLAKNSSTDYDTGWKTLTKSDVGLGNVDNTSDLNKPVSTAQQTAIDAKVADAINDGTTTIAPSQNAVFDALALKQPLDSDLTTIAGLTPTTDSFLQAKSSAWTTRTISQVKTDLGLTGTNSGDQTSIVGITGTKAQFNTAVSDGDIMYLDSNDAVSGTKTFDAGKLLDKGSLVFDVKAYGATGNGSTDDTSAISSAITAASGGGRVYFPKGTYIVTGITVSTSGVRLEGSAKGSSIIKMKNSTNATVISVTGTGTVNVEIANLTIDGNKSNQTSAGIGIQLNTPYSSTDTQHLIENVDITNTYGDGISIINDTRVVQLRKVRVKSAGQNAFNLAGSDHQIANCIADAAQRSGMLIYATNSVFSQCKAFYCDAAVSGYSGFRVEGGRNTFTSCDAQDNEESGWRIISATGNALVNCIGDSNGKNYSGAGNGLSIESSNYTTITGGQFYDRAANAFPQSYGIVISGTSTGCIVVGEAYYGNSTGSYNDTSSGTNTHSFINRRIISITSTVTGAASQTTDYVYLLGSGAVYTQPTAVSNTNSYTLKNTTSGSLAISSTSGQTFDGGSLTLGAGESVTLYSDNSNWRIA